MQLVLPRVGNSLTKATSFSKNASEVRQAPEYPFTNIPCSLNISALPGLRCTAFLGEMGLQLIKLQGPLKREELTTVCLPDCSVDAENLEWEAKQKVEPDWAGAGPSHLPHWGSFPPPQPPSQNGCLQGNSKTHRMLEKDAGKMNSRTLPLGMRISTVTWQLPWIFLKKWKPSWSPPKNPVESKSSTKILVYPCLLLYHS